MSQDLPTREKSTQLQVDIRGAKAPETSTSLLIRIRDQDDPEAWRKFVEQYGKRLLGFFMKKGLIRADAEELTQEVFVRISQRIPIFRSQTGNARNWIFTIASRIWIDMLRKRRRDPIFETIKSIEPKDVAAEFTEEDLNLIVAEALETTRSRLLREKRKNAERDFRIFRQSWCHNMPRNDIAQKEGMTVHAVGMVIVRVLPVFKEEVEKLIGDLP